MEVMEETTEDTVEIMVDTETMEVRQSTSFFFTKAL